MVRHQSAGRPHGLPVCNPRAGPRRAGVLARRGPRRHKVDFRVARGFRIRGAHRLRMEVDALNVINTNVAWGRGDVLGGTGIDFRPGPTFGYATQIVAPRIWRFGIVYEF